MIVLLVGSTQRGEWQDGKYAERIVGIPALDPCCSSNIANRQWIEDYMNIVREKEKTRVVGLMESNKTFAFGNGRNLRPEGRYIILSVI